jgi:hypothetical protein
MSWIQDFKNEFNIFMEDWFGGESIARLVGIFLIVFSVFGLAFLFWIAAKFFMR